jgi:hypothetical protein
MEIHGLIDELVDDYIERFPRNLGELWIKRVTSNVPEMVVEWPWLFFVLGDGDVSLFTLRTSLDLAPTRATIPATVQRNRLKIVHRFRAQLLVRPRRDLVEDEAAVRPFITPLLQVAAEDRHGEAWPGLIDLRPTGYKYGVFDLGRLDDKVIQFIGVEINFEARMEA